MERKELIRQPEYWLSLLQNELFRQISQYMTEHNMNSSDMVKLFGCGCSSKCVDEILNGEFCGTVGELVRISTALGKAPVISFIDIKKVDEYAKAESNELFVREICDKYNLTYYPGMYVYAPATSLGDLKCARLEIMKKLRADEITMNLHHCYFRVYEQLPFADSEK